MRVNDEGLKREDLLYALTRADYVMRARRRDGCLLCRRPKVNEAGLCLTCWSQLDEKELELAAKWTGAIMP